MCCGKVQEVLQEAVGWVTCWSWPTTKRAVINKINLCSSFLNFRGLMNVSKLITWRLVTKRVIPFVFLGACDTFMLTLFLQFKGRWGNTCLHAPWPLYSTNIWRRTFGRERGCLFKTTPATLFLPTFPWKNDFRNIFRLSKDLSYVIQGVLHYITQRVQGLHPGECCSCVSSCQLCRMWDTV
jgi:hypothetical protein